MEDYDPKLHYLPRGWAVGLGSAVAHDFLVLLLIALSVIEREDFADLTEASILSVLACSADGNF